MGCRCGIAPGADYRTEKIMKKQQFAFILGGTWLVGMAGIAAMGACSSDDSVVKDSGTKDQTSFDGGNKDVVTQDQNVGDGPGPDTGNPDCGSIPSLHTSEAGAIFCGFPADGGSSFSCTTGNQCCLGGKVGSNFLPEDCTTWGGACDNPPPDAAVPGVPIECNQNADCTANGKSGNVCCLQGAGAPAQVQGCGYFKSQGGTAILCEQGTTCTGATDIQICEQTSDCPNGKTCTPMKWKLYQLGFCM
jgi:hypothetical protein